MKPYFEIIDGRGVVASHLDTIDDAFHELVNLREENFEFSGDVKVVQVIHVE